MTINELITKYLGVPYKHQGRDLTGLDCYGLIINVYRDLGYRLVDIEEDYGEDWAWRGKNYFIENYHQEWERVTTPEIFDVVLFGNSRGIANHGGVMLNPAEFIHTARKAGTVISRIHAWHAKLVGFYHFKKR